MWAYKVEGNEDPEWIGSRSELSEPHHQAILREAATNHRCVYCQCRPERKLRLIPYEDPGGRGFNFRRFREDDDHAPGCMATELGAVFEPLHFDGAKYAEQLFDPADPANPGAGGQVSGQHSPKRQSGWYGDFTHLIQALLTRASIREFAVANAGRSYRDLGLVNAAESAVFWRLAELLSQPLMTSGASPAVAARRRGLEIVWGVTEKPLVQALLRLVQEDGTVALRVSRYWTCAGPQAGTLQLRISRAAGMSAGGKVFANGHPIPPPYFFAAAVAPSGEVSQLLRIPVVRVGDSLFVIESQEERRAMPVFCEAGVAAIKLHVHGDLRELGSRLWPFATNRRGRLPSRPDVIAFALRKVRVVYLAGSKDQKYLDKVTASVMEMNRHLAHPEAIAVQIPSQGLAVSRVLDSFNEEPAQSDVSEV